MANDQGTEKDKEVLLSIVKEISKSTTGAQSTKHWADDVTWFDIPPFASKGVKPAYKKFDEDFSGIKSLDVEILQTETFINGDMGVVCSVQRWNIVGKDDTARPPMLVRQTDCFERQNGQWKVIHEHSSVPAAPGWDGKIISEE
ncbi:MAG: nuclear transport factor 2 family protein [Candidatus Methanoplasma sp.]|jgi:ketosteroid isomerase-like protein|nr:nuclear transport factor 2 family protein [Candidatus Methanoplasma sp.]